jgi:TonB-dependent starch-binding outer membrane protein SusC
MKKFLLLSFMLCSFLSYEAWAQTRTVTGKVTSIEDGSTLPGVNVVLKGTGVGAITDANGNYSISVPQAGGRLVFSFIGMTSEEVEIGNRSTIDMQMSPDISQITEVVVTGYGVTQKRQVAGAITSVKGDVIENLPMQSFDRALQGRAAGVLVQSNNGIPGGAVNVRIRGVGSISAGNDPLYVVDGVQINDRSDANFTQSNPLAFLNANDIESIEILKDAASASIYGAQAANGVVIITTKKGKQGKSTFNFNYYTGRAEPLKYLNVLNSQDWYQVRKEARFNSGSSGFNSAQLTLNDMGRRPAGYLGMTEEELDAVAAGLPTYDWQREAMGTGKITNYELSVSGGDEKTQFYISGSYNKQDAIVFPTDFERGTLRISLSHKATNKLTIGTDINMSTFEQNVPFAVSGSFLGNPAFSASATLPHNPIYNEDGSFNTNIAGVLNQNSVAVVRQNSGLNRTNQAVGSINFSYKLRDNLTFRSLYGLDYRIVQGERYTDPRTPDGRGVDGRGSVQSTWNTNFITTQTLNYNTKFGEDHSLTALAGWEYRSETQESLSGSAIGFPSFEFRTINTAATPESIGGFWTGWKRMGVFSQFIYDYKKKYSVTATMRYDGSSRFGADNRWGFFPSIAGAWYMKDEGFLQGVDVISDMKLRASWGNTGNDNIGNFAARGLYGATGNYNGQGGIRPTSLANPSLGWENNQTVNLGIDMGFLNNRITTTVDVFDRQSLDLLLNQPILATSGFPGVQYNVGQLRNRGIEWELNTVNIDRGGFKWSTNFNFTYIENEVISLYDGLQELPGSPDIRVGESLGTFFVAPFAGVNPATGRAMWYDINDNITYQPLAADRRVMGNSLPNYFGGLNNTFSYKGFDLNIFFQYEYGRVVSDGQVSFLRENASRLTLNALQETFDARWTTPGQVTHIARPYNGNVEPRGANPNGGSANLQKADYIRLKQVTLAYNLQPAMLNRIGLSRARVYVQGVNLFTYSDYLGYDPEFLGAAQGIIPQSKNYTIGVQIGF